MLAKNLPLVLLSLFVAALTYPQQSKETSPITDPCPGSGTQLEMNQCMARHHLDADQRLNTVYLRTQAEMEKYLGDARERRDDEQIRYEEAGLRNLRDAERAWIVYRDIHCAAAKQRYEGGSIARMIYSECMWHLTEHRIEEFNDAYGEEVEK